MLRNILLSLTLVSTFTLANVSIEQATVRLLPPGVPNTSAYFTITNQSDKPLVLVGAQANFVKKAELHNHVHQDGMMKMQKQDTITVEAGKTVKFAPGGLHLMLFGLEQSLQAGQMVTLTLLTQDKDKISFEAKVKRPDAHHHHH